MRTREAGRAVASKGLRLFLGRPSTSALQLNSLDGLRGMAALAVVLNHFDYVGLSLLPQAVLMGYGKPGVYLFFSLSAFLLTLILLEGGSLHRRKVWLRYAVRRFLRIFPLYAVVLVLTWLTLGRWPGYQQPFLSAFALSDVGEHLLLLSGKAHFWTIAVEIQYYVLLPLVALGLVASRERPLRAIVCSLGLVGVGAVWIWPGRAFVLNTLNLGPYLPIFVLGSLAAFLHHRIEHRDQALSGRTRLVLEGLAILILLTVIALNGAFWFPEEARLSRSLRFAPCYGLYGVLWSVFLLSHLHGSGLLRRFFSSKPMRLLGAVSFSLYLLHPMLICVARFWVVGPVVLRAGVVFAVLLVASAASYLLVERSALRLGVRLVGASRPEPAPRGD